MDEGEDIGDLEALAETERALEAESEDRGEAEYAFGLEFAENLKPATPSPQQFETLQLEQADYEEDRRTADVPELSFRGRVIQRIDSITSGGVIAFVVLAVMAYFMFINPPNQPSPEQMNAPSTKPLENHWCHDPAMPLAGEYPC